MATYCGPCGRHFQDLHAYHQHLAYSSNHWDSYCAVCDKLYDDQDALDQHFIQSPAHFFCRRCKSHFEDDDDLEAHCVDDHHYCQQCDQFFKNALGLHEHNRQSHPYCIECRRVFNSGANLRAHLNSSLHRPRNVPCAFKHRECTLSFVSKSAMILHLESGTCTSGATRSMIDRWIRLHDRDNVITIPRRLITDGGSATRYIATERSWNEDAMAYECILCHHHFGTLVALNRHLTSPSHQEKIYRCPLSSCLTKFNTLSGLCQHVESERCGVLRFRIVREGMDNLLGDMHTLKILAAS